MDNDVYTCRLCFVTHHEKEFVIGLSSEEAKNERIKQKIFSTQAILITDHDIGPNYICKECYDLVQLSFEFVTMCRKNNAKDMVNVTDDMLKTEYEKLMKLPFIELVNKYQFNVKGLFDAVKSCVSDNNKDLSSTQVFDQKSGLNNDNSITNQFNIENDNPVGDETPEISPVLEVNEPQISENMCQIKNAKDMENVTNDMLKTEYKKLMRLPFIGLVNKYQFDVDALFDAVTRYLRDNNEHLSPTQIFDQYSGLNNDNSITNQFNIENENPVGDETPEISPVLEENEPQM